MRDVLAICRAHGQPPSWWDSLTAGDQHLLLAELQVRLEEERGG